MDSNEINMFAKLFHIVDFLGVFSVDELSLIPKNRNGLAIFNTDTSQNDGEHWIALCITKRNIFYFDSLNSNFQHSDNFTKYMRHTKKELVGNGIQITSGSRALGRAKKNRFRHGGLSMQILSQIRLI